MNTASNYPPMILSRCQPRPIAFFVVLLSMLIPWSAVQSQLRVDDAMYLDPPTQPPPPQRVFSPKLKSLWMQALQRPDAETRRLAADTVTIAVGRGMTGLEETTPALLEILKTDNDPVVRRAAARALIALNAKDAAPRLAEAAEHDGLLMAQVVEPALANWNDADIASRWLARIQDPKTERNFLLLAIQGLGAVRDTRAREPLAALTSDRSKPPELRLASARALGQLEDIGLRTLASQLMERREQPSHFGRQLAVSVLRRQRDAESIALLQTLATDRETTIAREALARLQEIDLKLAMPAATAAIASGDASLRRLAAEILVATGATESVQRLGPLLDDRNPGVRQYVAQQFVAFAQQAELRATVVEQTMQALASNGWRAQEQAALILGTLDHKPAAARLLVLLDTPRAEVGVAAAWGLRKLRIENTLPELLYRANRMQQQIANPAGPQHVGEQLSQLLQLFGEARYREADSLLRRFVPKSQLHVRARGAACWALGYLYENQPDKDLAKSFAERLQDTTSSRPEYDTVRQMTALALGRMKAESELVALRKMADIDGPYAEAGIACRWAVEQITGEKYPIAPPQQIGVSGWFLTPIDGDEGEDTPNPSGSKE